MASEIVSVVVVVIFTVILTVVVITRAIIVILLISASISDVHTVLVSFTLVFDHFTSRGIMTFVMAMDLAESVFSTGNVDGL